MASKAEITKTEKQEKQPKGQGTRFFSLRWKLLIGFTLLFSIVFALAFYWFYTFATQQALTRIKTDLLDTLSGAAQTIDGDVLISLSQDGLPNAAGEAWLAVSNAEDTPEYDGLRALAIRDYGEGTPTGFSDDPRYQQLMDELQTVHDIEPRAWPYLFVHGPEENQITYIADLWARYDPSKAAPFEFNMPSTKSIKGLTELTLRLNADGQFVPYPDAWGEWISAYTPVRNANGEIVGAIGIDFKADYVKEVQDAIQSRIVLAFFVTYTGLFLLVFLISRALTRPIQKLTVSAENLGEGDYSQDMTKYQTSGRFSDEIVRLAEVFAIMASKVYQREQNLRKQVEALQIQIDETKKQKQVSEIADTDFFRDLQAKAQSMRTRRTNDE